MSWLRKAMTALRKRFNPQQARDERGRWSVTGGAVTGKVVVTGSNVRARWNKTLGMTPKAYFTELLAGTGLRVSMLRVSIGKSKVAPKALKYAAWLTDDKGNHAGWLEREFYDSGIDGTPSVNHKNFQLEKRLQGSGIAKQVLRNAMTQYQRMGIGRIDTQASLSLGGYTWARFGFVPNTMVGAWESLKPVIKAKLYKLPARERAAYAKLLQSDDPKTTWVLADSKYGKALMHRTNYWAVLNMSDHTQMRRFRAYAGKRK